MKIIPLAADSMGVRSMATYVETGDCRALVDPGAAMGPLRYGLTPHPMEHWRFKKHWERIHLFAKSSNIVIVTHYHSAHFNPDVSELYRGKILLLKNPNQKIDFNQRNLAFDFIRKVRQLAKEVCYADARSLQYGSTRIVFSHPVRHGLVDSQGFVLQLAFQERGKTFLYSSDVNGPSREDSVEFIVEQNPETMYLDGPATYIQDNVHTQKRLEETLKCMKHIIDKTRVTKLIVDHHLLRDLQWKEKIEPLFTLARHKGIIVNTAAEYRGEENKLLEAMRAQLYENDPPPS